MKSSKEKYRAYCSNSKAVSIFYQDWWLDVVCGKENWDVVLIEENNNLIAYFPYYLKRYKFYTYMGMPKLTQTLGPVIVKLPENYSKALSREKAIYYSLLEKLPKTGYLRIKLDYRNVNWQPFYWKGFTQSTTYTYVLEGIKNTEGIFSGFQTDIRTEIRKAGKLVTVKEDLSAELFFETLSKTFERQNRAPGYSVDLIKKIDAECGARDCRKIFYAEDAEGNIHAAVFIIWDSLSAYYLMGGGDPKYRNSGANSLLLWSAIQYVAAYTDRFDFEGSMLEPVERYVRAFGGRQTPFHVITKVEPGAAIALHMMGIFKEMKKFFR